jgi:hypothetical protein
MIFDKGRSLTKEFCEFCKKEIKPGEKMILTLTQPSRERSLFNRMSPEYYGYYDNAPRYHEKCYLKKNK